MATNIKKYMDKKGVNAAELCKDLDIKPNTFSNWINAKIYPRINKIEMLAQYFDITKADLVEDSDNIKLTPHEKELIMNYRDSDDTTRSIVNRILLKSDD